MLCQNSGASHTLTQESTEAQSDNSWRGAKGGTARGCVGGNLGASFREVELTWTASQPSVWHLEGMLIFVEHHNNVDVLDLK